MSKDNGAGNGAAPGPGSREQGEVTQVHVGELDGRSWDAIVVGAGRAGAMCARSLAGAGRRVLLVERRSFPRDKACGDLLIPDSLSALRRAGLYDQVQRMGYPLTEAVVSSPSRIEWTIPGEFLTVKRQDLDHLVARGAAAAGATLARGEVVEIDPGRDEVRVSFRGGGTARGRICVVATGADVSLLEGLGLVDRKQPSAVAVRAYVRSPSGPERLHISFDRSIVPGYGWIFPLAQGEYNVGVGVLFERESGERTNLRKLLDRFLETYPPAVELMREARPPEAIRGARLRCGIRGARPGGAGRVLAAGETIGTTYPLTGEGVGKAMESGELAAAAASEALASGDPRRLDAYGGRVDAELKPRYRGYQLAQDWCGRPLFNDLLAWRARRSPHLRRKAAEMVAETADPREAVSLWAVVQSLWR